MENIYTGFNKLDKCLKIYKGDLVVIGALPAKGKTCLMCSMIERTLDKQKSLFFTMQTHKEKAIERLLLLDDKSKSKLFVYEAIMGFEQMQTKIFEHLLKEEVDVVYIDEFEDLLNCSYCSEKELVLKLKDLAIKFNIAIVLTNVSNLTSFRRTIYKDLRNKELIKYADKILTINRPDKRATEKELIRGEVKFDVAEISIDKDLDEYFSPFIELKFDNLTLSFNEIS